MARSKSVVLSPAEKKALVSKLKEDIKLAKDTVKAIEAKRKEAAKSLALVQKSNVVAIKSFDKEQAVADKALASLSTQLAALTAPAEQKAA